MPISKPMNPSHFDGWREFNEDESGPQATSVTPRPLWNQPRWQTLGSPNDSTAA